MMNGKYLCIGFVIALYMAFVPAKAQDAVKMAKHLTVTLTDKLDPNGSFAFSPQNPAKHGFERVKGCFIQAFMQKGLSVSNSDSSAKYIILFEYHYIYKIAMYRMQYSNLFGQIVDAKTKEIIGTFYYNGNYENENVSYAIAEKIAAKK